MPNLTASHRAPHALCAARRLSLATRRSRGVRALRNREAYSRMRRRERETADVALFDSAAAANFMIVVECQVFSTAHARCVVVRNSERSFDPQHSAAIVGCFGVEMRDRSACCSLYDSRFCVFIFEIVLFLLLSVFMEFIDVFYI